VFPVSPTADIFVQRPFNAEELGITRWHHARHVWLLAQQLRRRLVVPRGDSAEAHQRDFATLFGHPDLPFRRHPLYMPIYNTGVLAMHRETWLWVYEEYVRLWPVISTCCDTTPGSSGCCRIWSR